MNNSDKIFVAGHRGMVGSALIRKLIKEGFENLVLRTSAELNLCDQKAVEIFFAVEKPDYVFLAAAKVGGIVANNTYRADFLYDNLMIACNVVNSSYLYKVKKLMFFGSSCIYPKLAPQPLKEEYLLTGDLEYTNEPYAISKIAGIKLCEAYRDQFNCNYISVMPTNLYGPNDNYDLLTSHVLAALIRKFHEAKMNGESEVTVWGTGNPRREFLHVDDLADACFYLMQNYDGKDIVNIGTGKDISIRELSYLIKEMTGYKGSVVFDSSKPDGTHRKLMDVSKLHSLGWNASIPFYEGVKNVYEEFMQTYRSGTNQHLIPHV